MEVVVTPLTVLIVVNHQAATEGKILPHTEATKGRRITIQSSKTRAIARVPSPQK